MNLAAILIVQNESLGSLFERLLAGVVVVVKIKWPPVMRKTKIQMIKNWRGKCSVLVKFQNIGTRFLKNDNFRKQSLHPAAYLHYSFEICYTTTRQEKLKRFLA